MIHTPQHLRSITELPGEQLELVADAWRHRFAAAKAERFGYLHALVNEGRESGASLPHTHSQLAWFRETPPVPAAEQNLDRLLEGSVVLERDDLVLVCPHAARLPYEMLIAPAAQEVGAFESPLLAPALRLLADAVRRLRALVPGAPFNAWVHDVGWWHLELLPRLNVLAGIELGAGVYINTLAPEEAAARLRAPR